MKKNLKFIFFIIPLFVALSCEKDPQGGALKINAQVVNGNNYNDSIDEVKVFTIDDYPFLNGTYEVVSSIYTNGGFQIVLPNMLNLAAFSTEYQGKTLCVIPYGHFFAYKNGINVGEFVYKSDLYSTVFVYRDGRHKYISGNKAIVRLKPYDVEYEITVRAGWSTVYFGGSKPSTQKPKQDFNWYFISNN